MASRNGQLFPKEWAWPGGRRSACVGDFSCPIDRKADVATVNPVRLTDKMIGSDRNFRPAI